ncbi:MAG: bifunctional diguanylate cyclase/phosphodiesterase [Lachnospiraceae bacterium]|nr:bifunctional diguanylate cyclase/phosphodiesterase [Lachnospiraceae bacterium]
MSDNSAVKPVKIKEYNWKDVNPLIVGMESLFDLVRLVDPQECREISVNNDNGMISYGNKCYSVWNADHRCSNCTSLLACRTLKKKDRLEFFDGNKYQIQSVPLIINLADGTRYSCNMEMINIAPVSDDPQNMGNDKDSIETAGYLSTHDTLTGVLNGDGFCQTARELMSFYPDENWLIISVDIQNFKLVNSLFGIEKGDEILVEAGAVFSELSGRKGCTGRFGGDRFAILIPYRADIEEILIEGIKKIKSLIDGATYRLTLHAGIYQVNTQDLAISIMFDRAHMALQTIRTNREKVIAWFDESMLQNALHEQEVISNFEDNLRSGQFVIYLQPQINLDNRIIGAECLVRWILPDGQMVPPYEFIGILEKSDLIASLDRYVWELAIEQLDSWKDSEFADLYLSINVSPLDFYHINIASTIIDLCDKYNVPYEKLHVEITETAVADETLDNNEIIEYMQNKGFTIEIDDFGKGSSSLSLLKDLRSDVLKIDMGFLRKTRNNERGTIILSSVIDMAKNLGMGVITEGVETKIQLDSLVNLGCTVFQGYYFSKPVPVKDFEKMVRDNKMADNKQKQI